MKSNTLKFNISLVAGCVFVMSSVFSQITITEDTTPSEIGTWWITMNDTTANMQVDVGLPGADQSWAFMQPIAGIEINQAIVAAESTPFAGFDESDFAVKYENGVLDLIYSDVFPSLEGDVYFYQQVTDTALVILASGFHSNMLVGASRFEPNGVVVHRLPATYLDQWTTQSRFTIEKDTTLLGITGTYKMTINDNSEHLIDGWGRMALPFGEFDCLRMKSHISMTAQITFNGIPVSTRILQFINYNWLARYYGIVLRISSHDGEQSDQFTSARIVSRMSSFLPIPTAVSALESPPVRAFELQGNYPNPFNSVTSIPFQLFEEGSVSFKLYNLLGQEIRLLTNGLKSAGHHLITWNGQDEFGRQAPAGTYIYRLEFVSNGGETHRKEGKLLIVR
ncbi:T9SS type A sorting domain-containing protein [candidate division KSB1 bacterium]|nr:T9SS type A sorting domain-containing protein [candidate division KSB1 bacterium]